MSCVMRTRSGSLDLLNPDAASIKIGDIAWSLSRINRWNGMTHRKEPYSVAQHSLMVARLIDPRFVLEGLLHDAHEAFIGDITRPVFCALGDEAGKAITSLKRRIDVAIGHCFGVDLTNDAVVHAVKEADEQALQLEQRQLFGPLSSRSMVHDLRTSCRIYRLSFEEIESSYLELFNELSRGGFEGKRK